MSEIVSVISQLPEMEHAVPATESEVAAAETALGLAFAPEYREYLLHFGAAFSDIIAVSGLCDDPDYNVVTLTQALRPHHQPVPRSCYAIEDVGVDGLVVWQDATGTVYQSVPGSEAMKVFDSLAAFLSYQLED